jgi:hypothetical protein
MGRAIEISSAGFAGAEERKLDVFFEVEIDQKRQKELEMPLNYSWNLFLGID